MNTIRRLGHRLVRSPGTRTVRARLTLMYSALLLAFGAALLAVTVVLWGKATRGTVFKAPGTALQVLRIPAPKSRMSRFGAVTRSAKLPPTIRHQIIQVNIYLDHVAASQHSADLRHLLLFAGVSLALIVLLGAALGFIVAGRTLRPLRTITARTRSISASNLHERLALEGPDDELTELGSTIDELLERLDRSFEAQRQFAANASHELRTPLTTMRASVDVALAKPHLDGDDLKVLAGRLRLELDHVDELLEGFLVLAQAQQVVPGEPGGILLDPLVDSALSRLSGEIAESRLRIDRDEGAAAELSGNSALVARLVDNLLDNAVRHNVLGGFVSIRTSAQNGTARLVVRNGGPVIDPTELASLRLPFRRLGPPRTGSAGSGLGLSIVAAVVDSHGGHLTLNAPADGGLEVSVELPLVRVLEPAGT